MDQEKKEVLAMNMNAKLTLNEQMKFVKRVQKWEKVDRNTAWAICNGWTDPVEWKYTLGFKMADPAMTIALFVQPDKEGRRNAADLLMESLEEEEKEIFLSEVFDYEKAERIKDGKKGNFSEKRLTSLVTKSQKKKNRI